MEINLYNVDQVAKALQLNKQTILRFIREGKIKATKAGRSYRIEHQAVKDYLGLSTVKVATE